MPLLDYAVLFPNLEHPKINIQGQDHYAKSYLGFEIVYKEVSRYMAFKRRFI